jgi:hypothetical protein
MQENPQNHQVLRQCQKQSIGNTFDIVPVGNRRRRSWLSQSNPAHCVMISLRLMRARFRTRFRLPSLTDGDEWTIMWNHISDEEAKIADQVWMDLNEESQEILRNSLVIPDLLRILVDSRDKKAWIRNPMLPMLKYAHMIKVLQPPNWQSHFEKIQNWMIDFKLHELEPKVTEQHFQTQVKLLTEIVEKTRESWEKNHPN